ncbi:TetR/AcrR family transcriptional regulator [Propionibacteriaceae bacterium Y1923]
MADEVAPQADARSHILQVGVRLFARHGFSAVTVRQIAAEAGVSAPLVVHHFGSKQGLQDAVIEQVQAWFEEMLEMADAARARDAIERGVLMSEISVSFRSATDLPELMLRLIIDDDPRMAQLVGQFLDHFEALLAQYVDEGVMVDDPDPRMRAAIMLADDFGTMLLRTQFTRLLGVDPFVGQGLARYTATAARVYAALVPQGSWLDDPDQFTAMSAELDDATDEPGDDHARDHH